MQKQTSSTSGANAHHTPMEFAAELGSKAVEVVQTGATRAAHSAEKGVRKYPMAAVSIAFGGGAVVGLLTYRALSHRRPS